MPHEQRVRQYADLLVIPNGGASVLHEQCRLSTRTVAPSPVSPREADTPFLGGAWYKLHHLNHGERMGTELVQTSKLLARKKIFSFLGSEFEIFDANGNLRYFVKQKAFKIKEAITVFDETKKNAVISIQARSWADFSGVYDVSLASGEKIGSLKREGLKSMFRDSWKILDTSDNIIGTIDEDSMMKAMLRRFLSNLVPQRFDIVVGDQLVAEFDQHFNPFVAKFDLDFTKNTSGALTHEMGIAIAILLLAIEGRQS